MMNRNWVLSVTATLFHVSIVEAHEHTCPTGDWHSKLVIHQIAVGQGDSAFVRTPNGTTLLIDGGPPGRGTRDVLPTLRRCYALKEVDFVIASHPHDDHYGGLVEVLRALKVRKAIFDTGHSDSPGFRRYESVADSTGKRQVLSLKKSEILSSDDVRFEIVAVNGQVVGGKSVSVFKKDGKPKDPNALSVALVISYKEFRHFTAGDLTAKPGLDVEAPVADYVGRVDSMKADHHGSATSNSEHLLGKLQPQVVVISVGDSGVNRRYRLPNAKVMARLKRLASVQRVFQTAKGEGRAPASDLAKVTNAEGDVLIVSDGISFTVNGVRFSAKDEVKGATK